MKIRNVPCLIKNPPLRDIPVRESESFSPLALGFSMTIDYKTHELTIGHPKSQIWPQLDLAAPETWYEQLYEKYSQKHLRLGYGKPAERSEDTDPDEVLPHYAKYLRSLISPAEKE